MVVREPFWSGPIVLGSASPRRAALLASLGVPFVVQTVEVDEAALVEDDDPDGTVSVLRIARAKFAAFGASPGRRELLMTADTLVASGSTILGKPDSDDAVRRMLMQVSGRDVVISTALCVGWRGYEPDAKTVSTVVGLREIGAREREAYVASGAGRDKAGALALQSEAKAFVTTVRGCWSNVLGLPLCAVASALSEKPEGPSIVQLPQPGVRAVERQTDDLRCSVDVCGSCWGD